MVFAQQQNHPRTHFSVYITVIKQHMTVSWREKENLLKEITHLRGQLPSLTHTNKQGAAGLSEVGFTYGSHHPLLTNITSTSHLLKIKSHTYRGPVILFGHKMNFYLLCFFTAYYFVSRSKKNVSNNQLLTYILYLIKNHPF